MRAPHENDRTGHPRAEARIRPLPPAKAPRSAAFATLAGALAVPLTAALIAAITAPAPTAGAAPSPTASAAASATASPASPAASSPDDPAAASPAPAPTAAGLSAPAGTHPHILLITLDTVRADHTSAYGYRRPTTPRLEQVAREGVKVERAYAPMATTTPSHATMFTSLNPRTHGVTRNGFSLPDDRVTLAEVLARNGYRTGAIVSSYPVSRVFGLAQGFATYDDHFEAGRGSKMKALDATETTWEGIKVEGEFDRRGDDTRKHAVAWLVDHGYLPAAPDDTEARSGPATAPGATPAGVAGKSRPPAAAPDRGAAKSPFFLWVHFFDPHHPYDPPPEDAALFPPEGPNPTALDGQKAAYDGDIHFTDRQMGLLLDRLAAGGVLDDTLVVIMGDHGEGLMDHGWMFHGLMIYEEAVHVPLLVRWPRGGLPAGHAVQTPISAVDLGPTILDLVGVTERLPDAQGEAVSGWLRGARAEDPERAVFMQRRKYASRNVEGRKVAGEKVAVRKGRWKYIEAPEEKSYELYDLEKDPGELENVLASHPEEAAALASRLERWRAATPVTAQRERVTQEKADKLRALGYVQ